MKHGFLLKDGTIVSSNGWYRADLRVVGNRIQEISPKLTKKGETEIDCAGYYIYPGLTNSHDHLEFNLFPRLGDPPYGNAYEWGYDLHRRWKSEIEFIQRIPLSDRLWWGAWKNLFSGVTTVVHHNDYYHQFRNGYPLFVLRQYAFAHSLQFEPKAAGALKRRKKTLPFIIHVAEGIDKVAGAEIDSLHNIGGIDERTVAVHCIAITKSDIERMQEARASMIWCPSSNMYLFGRTAPIRELMTKVRVALGTDSTLTGSISMFDEIRLAQRESQLQAQDLFRLVTDTPREIFNLSPDTGQLIEGGKAVLFLIRSDGKNPYDTLVNSEPADIALLMQNGRITLSDFHFVRSDDSAIGYTISIQNRTKIINDRGFAKRYDALRPFLEHYTYFNSKSGAVRFRQNSNALAFVCPSCQRKLLKTKGGWRCRRESFTFPDSQEIPDFILPHRRKDVERFIDVYRTVRSKEQWGSGDIEYYLALPYRDLTGQHSSVWNIRSQTYDSFLNHLTGKSLRILDLGAGNCWLSRKLAENGHRVVAVDINIDDTDGLGVASRTKSIDGVSFECVRAEFERLPFPDESFDHIIFNASVHYSKDPIETVKQTTRCLKRNGAMWILDSPIYAKGEIGEEMVNARAREFKEQYGVSLPANWMGNYLTFSDINQLRSIYTVEYIKPNYGLVWKLRPIVSFLLGRRKPAHFSIVKVQKGDK